MTTFSSTLRGGLRLGSGQIVAQVCVFLRSVILARLISVEDYGVAAAFAMTSSLLEMVSNLSSDKLLVQASDGDAPIFQATAQFVHICRGFGNGAILFLAAGPISTLFGVPQSIWGFRCLSLLPISRGFLHLDFNRLQRVMRFGPTVTIDVVSNVIPTLAAYPIAVWCRNYNAMLVLVLLQSAVWSIGSHLVAERRYQCSWNRIYAKRMFAFGWPLLINGVLLYGIMQGDRVVIGSAKQLFAGSSYTLTDLGIYSVAFSLTAAPSIFVGNVATSLFLPILARVKDRPKEFQRMYLRVFHLICLISALISTTFIFAGPHVVAWIYGTKYAATSTVLGWLAVMWGVRTIRTAPILAALAHADTRASMFTNLVRSVAFLGVAYSAATGASLTWVAVSGLVGELSALPAVMWRISHSHHVSAAPCLKPLAAIGILMAATAAISKAGLPGPNSTGLVFGTIAMITLTASILILIVPQLRSDLRAAGISMFSALRIKLVNPGVSI